MNKPIYRGEPLSDVASLARLLNLHQDQLIALAENANSSYYIHKRIEKPDGQFREIYSVKKPLKPLQETINHKIYRNVYFPCYLHGAIKDPTSTRNHITDAEVHANAVIIVKIDISNYFPSITSNLILGIWESFFDFPPSVAQLLTKLTTFRDILPQGAPTSSGLANLVFWDTEHKVFEKLHANGFTYTRFVDDITVSSRTYREKRDLEPIFSSVFGMFRLKGVKPNRKKVKILTPSSNMPIHNLNINSGNPTIAKKDRSRIRAAVKECEKKFLEDNQSKEYEELWQSTLGRVNYLGQLHSSQARAYIQRLKAIQPSSSKT